MVILLWFGYSPAETAEGAAHSGNTAIDLNHPASSATPIGTSNRENRKDA